MSVSAEGNKERLIRGDTFELKLEKMSGNLSSRQEESRRHPGRRKLVHAEQKASRQAEAGTRREVRTGRVGSILSTRGRLISGASSTRGRRETARGGWVGRTTP